MWFVAAAIVASMLYVAALERKRDFAVLKALGSSSRAALPAAWSLEAVVVTLLAAALAEILASLLTPTLRPAGRHHARRRGSCSLSSRWWSACSPV